MGEMRVFSDLKKNEKISLIIFILIRITVCILMIWSIISFIKAHNNTLITAEGVRSRQAFVFFNCFVMLMASFLPSILEHSWKIEIPSFMEMVFVIFCFLCLVLGEIGNFYAKFRWWDSMLHTASGLLITSLGFVVLNTLNKSDHIYTKLSPLSVCIFALCFSVSIGAIWEIIEWILDGIAGTNMQRFRDNYDSSLLFIGRDALRDTMKDLILDLLGSLIVSLLGYIDLKRKKNFVHNLVLKTEDSDITSIRGWHSKIK
jgi:uncharacterized membrane protein YjdF